jgi:circadian clock protein KaiB
MNDSPEMAEAEAAQLALRLYVAGNASNSQRALANLKAIYSQYLSNDHCRLEIIDALQAPQRALADGVLVTPTLIRLAPLPVLHIMGDLSARAQVLAALGLAGEEALDATG